MTEGLIAEGLGISPDEIHHSTRGRARSAEARQMVMYLAHVMLGLSLCEVGRRYRRDRSTVAHACRKWEDRRDDPYCDTFLTEVEQIVMGACRLRFNPTCGDKR
ncbi:ATPase involved in DNA replication initiation [Polymorphum gilvum SL003B-26A1]|uniref:ATPase involved in DNA replication initiation n=2 Tax=Polymorphum TaxID=991903 RepID=F2IV44_POLGS|nr:ATPase involved in DNA replication initiation [Polymorphum gilvum SL003B-26A1]